MYLKKLAWNGEIGCEGGPVLVANLDDFEQWFGSEPFAPSMATELHYWSQFTSDLPEEWRPTGAAGHQYLASSDPAKSRESLMDLLVERWPGTLFQRGDGTWRATRPDGRTLNAALAPDSEYDSATRDMGADHVHRFGQGGMGYLWSASPGLVRIDVDEKRDFLLLTQIEFANDERDVQKAHDYALAANLLSDKPGTQYRVTSGPVVVAWSPNSVRDVSNRLHGTDTGPSFPGKLLDMSTEASGALLWLEPGLYQATPHYHEDDGWAVSCCRLQRIS